MEVVNEALNGIKVLKLRRSEDSRGSFVKSYQASEFKKLGLEFHAAEEYFTTSVHNSVRGLHFQMPPHHHTKIVYCSFGEVLDVVVDLRCGSPSFGRVFSCRLNESVPLAVFIPPGFAHGFRTLSERAVLNYKVSTEYHPDSDAGILWNSIPFDWGLTTNAAILSERDRSFSQLDQFRSPFRFSEKRLGDD